MRPQVTTPAHKTGNLAELVCSNSFKGLGFTSAHGLFKEELRLMGSRLLALAMESRVPAGESLAIDRDVFSAAVEKAIATHPRISLRREEAGELDPEQLTLVATGPLSSDSLTQSLFSLIGSERLYFFDSIAPVVEFDSLDMEQAFAKNRWEKGQEKARNRISSIAPWTRKPISPSSKPCARPIRWSPSRSKRASCSKVACPVEEMARRGPETLRYGPMRPIGLRHPVTGKTPFAVIQLRAENRQRSLYNLVGFQTRLKWGTQKQIFSLVPALKNAAFARFGAMHRNTFLNSPQVLEPSLRIKNTRIFCAGQLTGAEGYTEAIGTGMYASSMILAHLRGDDAFVWPEAILPGRADPPPDRSQSGFPAHELQFRVVTECGNGGEKG